MVKELLKEFSVDDMSKSIKDRLEKIKKENEDLKKLSKPYEKLIIPYEAIVGEVRNYNFSTDHTPLSEQMSEVDYPSYKSGYRNELEINLEEGLVEKLIFKGNSSIEKGNKIRAYIFAGEEKELHFLGHGDENNLVYIPRDFKKQEIAFYIQKIDRQTGKVLRTDYSVDYSGR